MPQPVRPVRVVVADDHALVRSGFAAILDAVDGIEVVAQASDGPEAVDRTLEHDPDVLLLDLEMPGGDGLTAAEEVLERAPRTKVVVLTTFDLDDYVHRALRLGVAGFLLKTAEPGVLADTVLAVARGESRFSDQILRRLVDNFVERPPRQVRPGPADPLAHLAPREREVLLAMADGLSNTEIARKLYVGEATVKTYVNRVLAKLGARDRVQAVILAYESGAVVPGRSGGVRGSGADE